ncbi:MAG: glutamate--tRNA ligase [Candidatus Diapherotrites archaeon]|nr:glutamate--tRNA ligase [Candidatus Diapherotrites archaeon]
MEDVATQAFKYAVKNAFLHGGKADLGAVIGKMKALFPQSDVKGMVPVVTEQVKRVNALSAEELKTHYQEFGDSYELKPAEKKEGLPELEWASQEPVVTRFAPNPNGPFHLGNARAAYDSWWYANQYQGKFFLRFDDTDPKVKRPMENAREVFLRDLLWLGIVPKEVYFASDRMEIYYGYMRKLVETGKAYLCTCESEEWRERIARAEPCPCRELEPVKQLRLLEAMMNGGLKEGEVVLRIKTDLNHPDLSVRDWWAAKRVEDPAHPRAGNRFHVWPSYNLASAIDDHELGTTLIIRGQEHEQNMTKQKFLYEFFGWTYPHAIHFGRIRLGDMVLSTSKIAQGIEEGLYSGWDDPRLGTIAALRRRGFHPESLKKALLDLGTNPNDSTIEISKLIDLNRKLVDPHAARVGFLQNPAYLDVNYCKETEFEKFGRMHALAKGTNRFLVDSEEMKKLPVGKPFRLSGAFNAKLVEGSGLNYVAEFISTTHQPYPIVNWIAESQDIEIVLDDHSRKRGSLDFLPSLQEGQILHLNRFGYARVDEAGGRKTVLYFTHR